MSTMLHACSSSAGMCAVLEAGRRHGESPGAVALARLAQQQLVEGDRSAAAATLREMYAAGHHPPGRLVDLVESAGAGHILAGMRTREMRRLKALGRQSDLMQLFAKLEGIGEAEPSHLNEAMESCSSSLMQRQFTESLVPKNWCSYAIMIERLIAEGRLEQAKALSDLCPEVRVRMEEAATCDSV
ncbi:hypothetical protein CYMTET_35904 [Cymbomonas tetramitiformis]|uniref:Uncharacterized protein n=1 Tax=Cymbomonas tetramitiformis TaxID=36881 RepID=A0AAE0KN79_9CHLO|nr:hypothetical protein CYMTET_35904 [Cymbomonas tetramitiformis]